MWADRRAALWNAKFNANLRSSTVLCPATETAWFIKLVNNISFLPFLWRDKSVQLLNYCALKMHCSDGTKVNVYFWQYLFLLWMIPFAKIFDIADVYWMAQLLKMCEFAIGNNKIHSVEIYIDFSICCHRAIALFSLDNEFLQCQKQPNSTPIKMSWHTR